MITKGQQVKIKPEFCENDRELTKVWVVVEGEEVGTSTVIIESLEGYGKTLNPQNRLSAKYLQLVGEETGK